jgi:hypothetical protein
MADDDLNETPDDSIGSALASALAEHETASTEKANATPTAAAKSAPTKPEAEQTDAAETPAEGTASETEAAEPKEDTGETGETKAEADKTAGSVTDPPANWPAKDKELFKKQPPDVQKFLLDRHKAMEGDYIKKTQAIAAFKREYEPVDKLFEPYRDRMKAGGWTPHKLVEAWSNVEKRLMEGDGINVVAGLVQGYKIDLGKVAQALGLRPRPLPNGSATEQPEQPAHDPLNLSPDHPVMRQLSAIQARQDAEDRARADEVRRLQTGAEARIMSQIEEFKSAQDDKGNPLHPHFDEVEEAMTLLAQSALAAKKPLPPLKDLYETAVWANPSTREANLAARERAQQEKAASEARAKAAQARKAGSSVTGAPGSGQAPNGKARTDLSLREQLEANFNDHAGGRI